MICAHHPSPLIFIHTRKQRCDKDADLCGLQRQRKLRQESRAPVYGLDGLE
jgi:hypothetical protein